MGSLDKFRLDKKVAIVTGAAKGLGKSIAIGLAEAGANIVIADINYEEAQKTAKEIAKLGVDTLSYKLDVRNEEEIKLMLKDIKDIFEGIDILVNNAGICKHIPAKEMKKTDWQDVIAVNLTGVFLMSKIIGEEMIKAKNGSIINIASISSFIINIPQKQCAYNASKAGVVQLSKSLAVEWAKYNIKVNAIAPGYMMTKMTEKYIENNKDEVNKHWVEPTPMKRLGYPEELQGAAIFLASQASSFITGETIVIDGGFTIC